MLFCVIARCSVRSLRNANNAKLFIDLQTRNCNPEKHWRSCNFARFMKKVIAIPDRCNAASGLPSPEPRSHIKHRDMVPRQRSRELHFD